MDPQLVLSLFPGIGMLDMAFEESGFCVVRGPDVLWGGDVKRFHPPADRFNGVIGGPPCQSSSSLRHAVKHNGHKVAENLIPEYERCIRESQPDWFLMENVPDAPKPVCAGYAVFSFKLNNRWLGEVQERKRIFSFGISGESPTDLRGYIQQATLEAFCKAPAICASGIYKEMTDPDYDGSKVISTKLKNKGFMSNTGVRTSLRLQGLPESFLDKAPFTVEGKQKVIGNGVPLPMGRAIAKAIVCALESVHSLKHPAG